ncbi:MAG: lipopolysaccharide heptosyltransferase II [Acidobacteriota bacterium]
MKILVRTPNWIGDAALSVAALRELRRLHSQDRVTLLSRSWVARLFEELQVADEVMTIPDDSFVSSRGPRLQWSALIALARRLKAERFDRAVLFQNAFEAALLAFAAGIPERIGYATDRRRLLLTATAHRRTRRASLLRSFAVRSALRSRLKTFPDSWWPARTDRDHEVCYYLDLLYQTGLSPVDYLHDKSFCPSVRLVAAEEDRAKAEEMLSRHGVSGSDGLVIINPGSAYGVAKRWLPERFAGVADRLMSEAGVKTIVFGWNRDIALAQEIAGGMRSRPVLLTGSADLGRTLGLIAASRLMITSDSGPMHLAAGLGIPQVALFGSTDPATTGPLGPSSHLICKRLDCSPCHLRRCPIDLRCWSAISVEEVVQAARELLVNAPGMSRLPDSSASR